MISKLICWFKGHKRGKRVGEATDIVTGMRNGMHNFYCPRCNARWVRKVKA